MIGQFAVKGGTVIHFADAVDPNNPTAEEAQVVLDYLAAEQTAAQAAETARQAARPKRSAINAAKAEIGAASSIASLRAGLASLVQVLEDTLAFQQVDVEEDA